MGGNVFADAIEFDQTHIPGIINEIDQVLDPIGALLHPIGSGFKPVAGELSGDLDIMIDQAVLSAYYKLDKPLDIKRALEAEFKAIGYETDIKGINVHVRYPLAEGSAQVDLMVVKDAARVARLHQHNIPPNSPYKGVNKQLALWWLAKQKGYIYTAFTGLKDADTKKFITNDLSEIVKAVISPNATEQDADSFEDIIKALPDNEANAMITALKADPQWKEKATESTQPLSFIREIHESRFTRNSQNVARLSFTDCCERIYLTILVLEMMRHSKSSKVWIAKYANQTRGFEDFKVFRLNGTDLYNFMYLILSKDGYKKLKDPDSAQKMLDGISIPRRELNQYLVDLAKSQGPSRITSLLLKLETGLNITNPDYKNIRRTLNDWPSLKLRDKQIAATKLLYAVRAKLRATDVVDDFSRWVQLTNAETYDVVDTEPTVSVPDISLSSQDISLYRYLVGSGNLAMLEQFLKHAKDGRSISAPMVKAYQPIIQLIDDIVQGGPGMVTNLKTLRSRAQKRNK